jgi:crotonobetainyl-CoA:carnitine CoA-transferase CaiB-like acyl-CoA transferase
MLAPALLAGASMTKPLDGILIADFTTLLPGPLATLMLAEAGAEVVKVERPGGEEVREFTPRLGGHSAHFALLNRGKKSLVADLKTEAGRKAVTDLVARADVLVEQFRPGVMERLGLGYEAVRAINSRIIYCSITGYGQSGPRRLEAGHDLNYIGATGLLSLSPGPPDRPVVPPGLIADIGGGTFPAVTNILLALIARGKSAEGAYIDIAMTDAMFTFAWYALAVLHATGRAPGPGELRHNGGSPRYQLYPTKDGKLVACAALEDHFWQAFSAAIGLDPALMDDRRDSAAADAVRKIIAGKTAAHWKPILAKADCCATVIVNLQEAVADPHFIARGLFERRVAAPDGSEMPALPLPIALALRVDDKVRPFPPLAGEAKS